MAIFTTERLFMNDKCRATGDRDALDNFAAELTRVAYYVALRHGTAGTWIDLQLDLWQTLGDAIQQWEREPPPDCEVAFACDWAGDQSEAVHPEGRGGLDQA
jgi:hypothetical protein